jgi:hypothetical protein
MKADGSNWGFSAGSANAVLALRNEASLQGIDPASVSWMCGACYGSTTVPSNAAAFEGEWQSLGFLPFDETRTNKTLAPSSAT